MRFYDRTNELATLAKTKAQSTENACFTVMIGRRRIGKTSLLLKAFEQQKMLYLFVSRNSEAMLCSGFQKQANAKKISLQTLAMKTVAIHKQLSNYEVSFRALSMNEM